MELRLVRNKSNDSCTIGELFIGQAAKAECFVLEDVVRSRKIAGETAIPVGRYKVLFSYSPRFGQILPELLDVPGFVGIRIHAGNTTADTEGCLLLGKKLAPEGNAVLLSRFACASLFSKMLTAVNQNEPIWITVL